MKTSIPFPTHSREVEAMIDVERQVLKKLGGPNLRATLRVDPTLAELFH